MSTTTGSTVVTARINTHHVDQLRQLADANASTVSRTLNRIVAEKFDGPRQPVAKATDGNDDRK